MKILFVNSKESLTGGITKLDFTLAPISPILKGKVQK